MRKLITTLISTTLLGIFLLTSCSSYNSTFDFSELQEECGTEVTLSNDGEYIIASPTTSTTKGLIFYPGGLVSYEAYLPLMIKCAKQGIKCIIVQMPSDFAILNMYAAKRVQMRNTDITKWYLAGHSLGGAMAASYIAGHSSDFEGLILLAAYSTADITSSGLKVLSAYGTNDKVLNAENYSKYRSNLPSDFTELIIEGGNHGHFASYGEQSGDGEATITAAEQQELTASAIGTLVN